MNGIMDIKRAGARIEILPATMVRKISVLTANYEKLGQLLFSSENIIFYFQLGFNCLHEIWQIA